MLPELLEGIYAAGEVHDGEGNALTALPAALPRNHALALAELVRGEGATRTLETGMAYGASTLAIAAQLPADGGWHVAVDPFQFTTWRGVGMLNAERAGLAGRVELLAEPSEYALPRLAAAGRELDLALIDGSHLFDHTLLDFFYVDRMLRDGGVAVFHDTWMPAVRQAASFVLENRDYARVPAGDDAMWAVRKLAADDRAWDFHRDFAPVPSLRSRAGALIRRR